MTSVSKKVAGGLTVLEAVWAIYIQFAVTAVACPLNGCPGPQFSPLISQLALLLGVILLVDGLLGVWGSWFAFPTGALLSAILLLIMGYAAWADSGYAYLIAESNQALVGAGLAVLALVTNVLATRTKNRLSEQANPMNLPVFG